MFLIPYNKLANDQKGIIRRVSRDNDNLFVEGPPGSGKTLISLYTIKDLVESQLAIPLVMIYNHSLYGYLQSSFKELGLTDNITIVTKDKFFWDLAKRNGIWADHSLSYKDKYDRLLSCLLEKQLESTWDVAIIDEVQDMSNKEWKLVKKLARKVTSMGDFNQGIYESDLKKKYVTEDSRVEQLFDVFRFHKNIAKVAENFSKKHDGLEKKVKKIEQKQVKLLDVASLYEEKEEIINILYSLKSHRNRIGIISPNKEKLSDLHATLSSRGINAHYFQNNRDFRVHDFNSNDPLLITCYSAKGLEFENVIVFGFDQSVTGSLGDAIDELIYVSVTRSNSGLYIIRNPETISKLKNLTIEEYPDEELESFDDIF
ncbi:MAG: UvrD-helicase domain-containing protein [Bacteroidota bacterium]